MNGFASAFEFLLSLLFIIFLAIVSIRLLGKKTLDLSGNRYVRIISAQSLGQNKSLHTVVVDDKTVLLVGVGTHVELVARFDDTALAEKLLAADKGRRETANSMFYPAFSWLDAKWRKVRSVDQDEVKPDFSVFLRDRFELLKSKRQEALGAEEEKSIPDERIQASEVTHQEKQL
ncbi:flagellar biosynthetic protein FliO [Sulfoacidibacillus thermotolerans]|uniref:Flagellar protein n=1 Tax=Sulfoacidibacillus thermotolerans TaxID=1765684 RepID=A0A2U3DA84_SULT2|nr:flagellar biosynthetic protein FliO [Sulfoacidibacillus thermotolerans]PWI58198.1 hypothetical protein BM613_04500 [Sulfoacidibacillus thermotolerans]